MLAALLLLAALPHARPVAVPVASNASPTTRTGGPDVVVGSKPFAESHLLGEIMTQLLRERTGLSVEHKIGLGGTLICHEALVSGEIDLYAEYTGTAWAVVLGNTEKVTSSLRTFLGVQDAYRDRFDLEWLHPFGLNNTYVLAIDARRAAELHIRTLSDLAEHPGLRAGFSLEFLNRADGYPGLAQFYGLDLDVRGIDHGLAYDALRAGEIDLLDAYSTDGKLREAGVRLLIDDRSFFPPYEAAPVVREQLLREHPNVRSVLNRLAFQIDDATMAALNHRVEVEGAGFEQVARDFLVQHGLLEAAARATEHDAFLTRGRLLETLRLTGQHVFLTLVSVLLATLLAVPLGIWITRNETAARLALGTAGILQTVPSLALLATLIAVPGLGLSRRSAIFALFLYALLPILRNTYTGVRDVDPELVDAARAIGLTERETLLRIRLPLSIRTILAGVRTATVISIGVATLAAFIGAGGLGEPIITGLYLNDTRLILSGAVPAALLALVADFGLGRVERVLTPRGLRA